MVINSAVIGMGIGQKHLESIDGYKNFRVTKICEFNTKKLTILKKKYKSKIITQNEDDIFKDKNIKLISIASYDEDHFRQIKKCIKFKKYFIVEKPICLTFKELIELNDLIKKNDIKLFSNLVLRVNSKFKNIKTKINNKEVFYLEADYIWGRKHKLFGWRAKTKNYSLTLGAAIHMIDLVMWFLNSRPIAVTTFGSKKITQNTNFKKDSFLIYIFEFPNNKLVKITANAVGVHNHFHQLKIFEKNKTIEHTFEESRLIKFSKNEIMKKKIILGNYPDKSNRKKLIQNFLDNILNKKTKLILSNKEQLDLMNVCFFADESLKKRKKIKIKYFT